MKIPWRSNTVTPEEAVPFSTRLRQVAHILAIVTLIFFKLGADSTIGFLERDLRLQRFCRLSDNFTQEECDLMQNDNFTYVKDACQDHEDQFDRVSRIIYTPISFLVIAFAATWSDKHGRIFLLRLSIVGYFIAGLIYILFTALEEWPVEVLLAASFFRSIAGGSSLFVMAVFSMIVDKTTWEDRRLRLGTVTNLIIIGEATGPVQAIILERWSGGYFWVIFTALLYYIVAMGITIFFLKEDPADFETRELPRHRKACVDFIHPKNISDVSSVPFKRRPQRDRLHLLLILFVTFFVLFSPPSHMKDWTTTFLRWSSLNYYITSAVFVISCQVVTLVFLRLTSESAINECLLAAIAEGMTAVQDLLLASVIRQQLSGIVYFANVFSLSHNLSNVAIRYAICKITEEREIGRVFGIMALQETVMIWVKDVTFAKVYNSTRDVLPTSQHILSASFGVLNSSILLGVYLSVRNLSKRNGHSEEIPIMENVSITRENTAKSSETGSQSTTERDNRMEVNSISNGVGYDNVGLVMDTKF